MAVCVFCGGRGFSLGNGLCSECNGAGESNFDYDDVMLEDDPEDTPLGEPLDNKQEYTTTA